MEKRKKEEVKGMTIREMYDEVVKRANEQAAKAREDFRKRIAKATACSERTAQNWIYGVQKPSRHVRILLAREFGTTPEALFREEAENESKGHDNGTARED